MADQSRKKIYWIGGNLSRTERDVEWIPYGAQIQEHYRKMGGENSGYDFVWVSRCTVKQFARIWSDPNTCGIIWYSHGEAESSHTFTGYPLAYSMYLDESWRGVPRGEQWEKMKLDPRKLPVPSPNLKFIAIKSCGSAELHDQWQQKAPNTTVITHQGQLFRRESSRYGNFDQMLSWAKKGPGWTSKGKVSEGAGYLFELLPRNKQPTGGGCGCNFGLREYWTSSQSSTQQVGPSLVFRKQYFPKPAAPTPNPLRELWDQGNRTASPAPPPMSPPPPSQRFGSAPFQKGGIGQFNYSSSPAASKLGFPQQGAGPKPWESSGTSTPGSRPAWRPESTNPSSNPLRSIWDRGIGSSPAPSGLPDRGPGENPLRQLWDQGNRPRGQQFSSLQNRTQNPSSQNPLRQLWDQGNKFR